MKIDEKFDVIDEKAVEILKRKKRAEVTLEIIAIGMSDLSDYQKELLTAFYVDKEKYTADKLCERYFVERSTVYEDKTRALEIFSRSIAGIFE